MLVLLGVRNGDVAVYVCGGIGCGCGVLGCGRCHGSLGCGGCNVVLVVKGSCGNVFFGRMWVRTMVCVYFAM